jgi:hypothetical protein
MTELPVLCGRTPYERRRLDHVEQRPRARWWFPATTGPAVSQIDASVAFCP